MGAIAADLSGAGRAGGVRFAVTRLCRCFHFGESADALVSVFTLPVVMGINSDRGKQTLAARVSRAVRGNLSLARVIAGGRWLGYDDGASCP